MFEEYYPLDQIEYSATVNKIMTNNVNVVFNTVIPPGVRPFIKQLYEAGFTKKGGRLSCVYYDENTLNINAANEFEGLASCLDYFRAIDDSVQRQALGGIREALPGHGASSPRAAPPPGCIAASSCGRSR